MTESDLIAHRLAAQRLSQSTFSDPQAAVSHLGAVQSQDYPAALWALALRLQAITASRIGEAFDAGDILRTHVLRPTWHFVAPRDVRWMLALTGPRIQAGNAGRYRRLDLDDATRARCRDIIATALTGGHSLTRPELAGILDQQGMDTARGDNRLSHIMMDAELSGLIVSGPMRGKLHTYALLDERVPPTTSLDRDQAVAELVLRYFTSHGPATVHDFVWWSGLTVADAKRGLAQVSLDHAKVGGAEYWFANTSSGSLPQIMLLPNYDEYTVAYRDRSHIFDVRHAPHLDSRANPLFQNVLLVDGRVAGTWRRTIKPDSVLVDVRTFESKKDSSAIQKAATIYADFLGLKLELSVQSGQ